ncbi:proline-rich protein 36-like [Homarus americanus]|uniref:Uncharacterized protein n=1 Tax=Homarus americanus TaxID=6706 RepID=A0A8J5MZ18_HOMAM|nr:proline-rich protein 36-like [Homarus americanus]KAG7168592.1 hypothetical protein Hamer_G021503 [Homarus americanus]
MPCNCFGKKDKKGGVVAEEKYRPRDSKSREREPLSAAAPAPAPAPATPPPAPVTPTAGGDARLRPEDDPDKANRRRDVVASFYSDQCELIGFKATGSRPPSTHVGCAVDGPAATSSPAASSPGSARSAASCRADLAEKRREFFKQLTVDEDDCSRGGSRPTSRLTDPGSHTTPRHSHYQDHFHHHSLPHPPKPAPRTIKYSLPNTSSASEDTQPLLQPSDQHTPEINDKPTTKQTTEDIPLLSVDEPDQSRKPGGGESPDVDQTFETSSPLPHNQPSGIPGEPLLQVSPESEHLLVDFSVSSHGPEKFVDEFFTDTTPLIQDSPIEDNSQVPVSVSSSPVVDDLPLSVSSQVPVSVPSPVIEDLPPYDGSQVLVSVPFPRVEDLLSFDNSQVLVNVSPTVVEDIPLSDSSQVLISSASSPLVEDLPTSASSQVLVSEAAPESPETFVVVTAPENSELTIEQLQYFQQFSVPSDDERVAEGSCILINEAFPAGSQDPTETLALQRNHPNKDITQGTPQPLPHDEPCSDVSSVVEDEPSQRSGHRVQESTTMCTDEVHQEVPKPIILENSQQNVEQVVAETPNEPRASPVEARAQPEAEETVLNHHQEQVPQSLPPSVDPSFLTSAEEPEELPPDQPIHQSAPHPVEKPVPKQRSQLPGEPILQLEEVRSTVEIVDCIPKVQPVDSTPPQSTASEHEKTDRVSVPLFMTVATEQDDETPLPPAPPTPPVEDEPLPPPPPTPPLKHEPLPPAPPTPPISSEPRLPPVTCSVGLVSSSPVLEDDGLGSEIDDALSSLECLSEEGNNNNNNSSERAAASS